MNSELSTASQPQHHHHPELLYNNQRYASGNMADQFQPHTPSFGDDEFDIGSLGLMGHHVVMAPLPAEHQQQQQQHVQQQQQQHHPMMHQQHQFQQQQQHHQPMYHNNSLPATDPSGGHHYGMYNNPHMDGGGYTLQTLGSSPPPQQQQQQQQPVNRYSPQQQQQQQNASTTRINLECRAMPEGSVVEMQQQHRISNAGTTVMAPPSWTGGVVVPTTVNTSPLGSNVSATPPSGDTSEESGDDSHSILLMGNAVKRPSPEPLDATPVRNMGGAQAAKKAKVTQAKKKKRRDPHEPQKPVSAYALFFRDTQAAIKGQNPNASFGEVSKIVASMWDALDTDSKNVYKKKTEAAKKEYLKALAAYRASVVSKEGNGEQQAQPPMFQPPPPQQQQQQQQPNNFPVNNYQQNQYNIPQQQQQQQQQYTASMAAVSAPHLSPNKKPTPLLNSLMADQQQQQQFHQQQNMQMQYPPMNNQQQQQQQRPAYMNQQQAAPQMIQQQQQTMNYSQHLMQQQGQQQQQQGQQQQQRVLNQVPTPSQLGNKPAVNNGNNGLQHPHCIRSGCPNAAIPSPDWENEYCSNECVVSHCRDVFSAWVASSQGAPPGYPPPVK